MKKRLGLLSLWITATLPGHSQTLRLPDYNTLAWFAYAGDYTVAAKWKLHAEYQFRRVNWVGTPQQHLSRGSVIRTLSDRVEVSAGYAHLITYRYGKYPTVADRPEPSNRIYEDISLSDQLGRLHLTHRIRLEQRWLSTRADDGRGPVNDWTFQNRIRYQLAGQFPLQGPTLDNGEWYLNAFAELFINFGRNVGDNVFNQNRLSGGVGYQLTKKAKLELNYLNQITQHEIPDLVSNRPVFEYNNGFRLNVLYDLDFTKGG